MLERLHKVLARAGVAALRPAEDMIMAGRVTVNGRVVRELGARVDPDTDQIAVDGTLVQVPPPSDARRYVVLHKPAGVISTAQDTHGRPTVVDLIPSDERLFPVGRLDADSEGLILLTNDGDVAYRLTHPRFEVEKEYRVLLDRTPDVADLRRWRDGVELDGEMTLPVWAEILDRTSDGTWVRIVMREGRNRQIRNVAQLLGYQVLRLIRVREGSLNLGDVEPGQWRELTGTEIDALRAHVRHIPGPEAEQRPDERAGQRPRVANDEQRDDRDRSAPRRPRPAWGERDRGAGERRSQPASEEREPGADERRARPALGERDRGAGERRPRGETNADQPRTPLSDRRSDDRPRSIRDVGRRSDDRRPTGGGDRRSAGPTRGRAPFGSRERTSGGERERAAGGNHERTGAPRTRTNDAGQRDQRSPSSMRSGLGRGAQRSPSSMRSGLGRGAQGPARRAPDQERTGRDRPSTRGNDDAPRAPSGPRGRSLTRPGSAQRPDRSSTSGRSTGGQRTERSSPARGGGRSDGGNTRGTTSQRGTGPGSRAPRTDGQRTVRPQRSAPVRRPASGTSRPPRSPRRRDDEE